MEEIEVVKRLEAYFSKLIAEQVGIRPEEVTIEYIRKHSKMYPFDEESY